MMEVLAWGRRVHYTQQQKQVVRVIIVGRNLKCLDRGVCPGIVIHLLSYRLRNIPAHRPFLRTFPYP